jgi:small GTP-binding protein
MQNLANQEMSNYQSVNSINQIQSTNSNSEIISTNKNLSGVVSSNESLEYMAKIVICGEGSVGKTSLVLRYTDQAFSRTYIPTIGVNISKKTILLDETQNRINFTLWDVGAQANFKMFRRRFYEGASAVIFVCDLTNRHTYDVLKNWIEEVRAVVPKYIGVFIGNKCDLQDQRQVTADELKTLGEKYNMSVYETSCLTGTNVEELFLYLAKKIVKEDKLKSK